MWWREEVLDGLLMSDKEITSSDSLTARKVSTYGGHSLLVLCGHTKPDNSSVFLSYQLGLSMSYGNSTHIAVYKLTDNFNVSIPYLQMSPYTRECLYQCIIVCHM